jgi:hypothetical protein
MTDCPTCNGTGKVARQSVSITGVQAHELLAAMMLRNATSLRLTALETAVQEIAQALGGESLIHRINEQLGKQLAEELGNDTE